jgi:hypothetical protein
MRDSKYVSSATVRSKGDAALLQDHFRSFGTVTAVDSPLDGEDEGEGRATAKEMRSDQISGNCLQLVFGFAQKSAEQIASRLGHLLSGDDASPVFDSISPALLLQLIGVVQFGSQKVALMFRCLRIYYNFYIAMSNY